jgi:hypothetical protein
LTDCAGGACEAGAAKRGTVKVHLSIAVLVDLVHHCSKLSLYPGGRVVLGVDRRRRGWGTINRLASARAPAHLAGLKPERIHQLHELGLVDGAVLVQVDL